MAPLTGDADQCLAPIRRSRWPTTGPTVSRGDVHALFRLCTSSVPCPSRPGRLASHRHHGSVHETEYLRNSRTAPRGSQNPRARSRRPIALGKNAGRAAIGQRLRARVTDAGRTLAAALGRTRHHEPFGGSGRRPPQAPSIRSSSMLPSEGLSPFLRASFDTIQPSEC